MVDPDLDILNSTRSSQSYIIPFESFFFYVALDLTNSYYNCQKMLQHTGQNPMQKLFSRWFQIIFSHRFIYISISVRSTTMGITLQKLQTKFMNESVVHMHVQKNLHRFYLYFTGANTTAADQM